MSVILHLIKTNSGYNPNSLLFLLLLKPKAYWYLGPLHHFKAPNINKMCSEFTLLSLGFLNCKDLSKDLREK